MNKTVFNIAFVERDTGLSKDVLRVWERRYGFPQPSRDSNGERYYPPEQVARLRQIKRLMDQGHRPGKLMAMPLAALASLSLPEPDKVAASSPLVVETLLEGLLDMIKQRNAPGFQQEMQRHFVRRGLPAFLREIAVPLAHRVGKAWEEGSIQVYEEHFFTELTTRHLRQIISSLTSEPGGPRILLTSVANERHALALLMVEAMLILEGAECVPLGVDVPLQDIAHAAAAHGADIVALSFSSAFPLRQIPDLLLQMRRMLPAEVVLWSGGSGLGRLVAGENAQILLNLDDAVGALAQWRAARGAEAVAPPVVEPG